MLEEHLGDGFEFEKPKSFKQEKNEAVWSVMKYTLTTILFGEFRGQSSAPRDNSTQIEHPSSHQTSCIVGPNTLSVHCRPHFHHLAALSTIESIDLFR